MRTLCSLSPASPPRSSKQDRKRPFGEGLLIRCGRPEKLLLLHASRPDLQEGVFSLSLGKLWASSAGHGAFYSVRPPADQIVGIAQPFFTYYGNTENSP